jgi:cellulose synthase/poly-beta-1,6-N-acetylglucosamine synthase-like glycosyltransferase
MNNGTMRGLTTIIVPCWNQVSYTQRCIAALKQHTRPPWELIVVNNGSTDETGSYLAGVRDLAAVPVAVVNNAANLGFPAAINQGFQTPTIPPQTGFQTPTIPVRPYLSNCRRACGLFRWGT